MAETKLTKAPVWQGNNESEVNEYLKGIEGIDWHYVTSGGKKELYLVKNGAEKCIKLKKEVTW